MPANPSIRIPLQGNTPLTSLSLALLDPQALCRFVENWFFQPMDQHLATDYVTRQAVGPCYGVYGMAILHCAYSCLRVTGDFVWLDHGVGDKTALDHLLD